MDILKWSERLVAAVEQLVEHTRQYYYAVMLSGHTCPQCDSALRMIGQSRCECTSCHYRFDPTEAFQCCSLCGGRTRLRVCRYQCRRCKADVPSRFVCGGRVFDSEYFRAKMAESRQRKVQAQRERHEQQAARTVDTRSEPWTPPPIDFDAVPGLASVLDNLTGPAKAQLEMALRLGESFEGFDLNRYETHLQAHIGPIEVCFDDIPSLMDDRPRLDRIWRFVAMIFLAHGGQLIMYQENNEIWVRQTNAIDRERPRVPEHTA